MLGQPLAGAPEKRLKLPTACQIYTQAGPDAPWTHLQALDWEPRMASETSYLIQEFVKARIDAVGDGQPEPKGVLVKIVGSYPSWHNPADTPMLTVKQYNEACSAGIEAILLDARCGVSWPATKDDDPPVGPNRSGVYGV